MLALITTLGCRAHHTPPRPPIEALTEEAIIRSHETRRSQQAIVESASWNETISPHISEQAPDEGVARAQWEEGMVVVEDTAASAEVIQPPGDLTEEFIETDVREALIILGDQADVDVLIDDKARGVVNVSIEDETFESAIEKVLLPLGFVYGKRRDQYVICPPDPDSPLFPYVSTQVEYRPQHAQAEQLLAAPPKQMLRFVRVVEDANVLVIEAPTQHMGFILERIRRLDQPTPQVELEAIVCVVSPDSGFRFGLDWGRAVEMNGETAMGLAPRGSPSRDESAPAGSRICSTTSPQPRRSSSCSRRTDT
ncbi:MAG: hypothetical protein AAGJ46_16075 [Planctomycetota bacterium]